MAELGIAASIIQIAGAGIHLTMELYAFGSAFTGAKEDTDDIALGVSLYCMTLKHLAETLRHKNSVQSPQALQGIADIREKSEQVFARIAAILPRSAARPDTMTLVQRFKWNFKKARVNLLLGQLDSLKLTLLLLVQILAIGEEAQKSHFEFVKPKHGSPLDKDKADRIVDESDIAVQTEMLHAVVLNKQRHQAVDLLTDLQAAAEREDKNAINAAPMDPPEGFVPVGDVCSALVKYHDQALVRIDRLMSAPENVDDMALVVYMLDQWTIVRYVHDGSVPPQGQPESTISEYESQTPNPSHVPSVKGGRNSHDIPRSAQTSGSAKTGKYKYAYVEDDFSEAENTPAKSHVDSGRVEEISDEEQAVAPRSLRRATTSGTDIQVSRKQLSTQRRKTIAADVSSLLKKPNNDKLRITWRRGNDHAWREFTNQKLMRFDVDNVVLNVNKTHFGGDDTWTEFKTTDRVTITAAALKSHGYPFYEYQRYSYSYYNSYDENGQGVGDPIHVYDPVIRVKLPLVYVCVSLPFPGPLSSPSLGKYYDQVYLQHFVLDLICGSRRLKPSLDSVAGKGKVKLTLTNSLTRVMTAHLANQPLVNQSHAVTSTYHPTWHILTRLWVISDTKSAIWGGI